MLTAESWLPEAEGVEGEIGGEIDAWVVRSSGMRLYSKGTIDNVDVLYFFKKTRRL